MSQLQRSLWKYGTPSNGAISYRISAEGIIIGCATGFPVLTVVSAICQLSSSTGRNSEIFLPLAVLSAFFCTLLTCLAAHLFADSRRRGTAVFVGGVLGLSLLWCGFSYIVFQSTFFQSTIKYVSSLTEHSSRQIRVETGNEVDLATQMPRAQPGTEEQEIEESFVIVAAIFTLIFIPAVLAWSERHLAGISRFRILLCVTCLSWLIVAIAWTRIAPDGNAYSNGHSALPAQSTTSAEQQIDVQSPAFDAGDILNRAGQDIPIPQFAFAALFAVPVFFSIPFIQLFLTEFTDTTKLARIWMVMSVLSLSIIALMAMVAPRLFGENTLWLSTSGVALTVFSAWVILPLVRDVPTSWTATHVCGLTWIVGGYVLLGRPWTMTPDQLLRSLAAVVLPAAVTLIHMLLGLYSPKRLATFEHLSWWLVRAAILTLCALFYWQPAIAVRIVGIVFWTVVLLAPFSSTPSEILYLRYLIARYSSIREIYGLLWGLLRRRPAGQTQDPNWIQRIPSMIEPDPAIVAALPESETIQYCLRARRNDKLDPLTLAVAVVTTVVIAVSYSAWRSLPGSTLRQNAGPILISLGFLTLTGWLLLIRFHSARQSLVLGNSVVGWWNGTDMEWMISYDAVLNVRVWNQRLMLHKVSGGAATSGRLSDVWPAANFIESRKLGQKMTATLGQLDENEKIDYGPIALSWEGLSVRGRTLPWDDVGKVQWNAGRVAIVNRRGTNAWAQISAREVPNPLCLRTTVLFFHAVRVFLSSVTESRTSNPRNLFSVLRSVRGTDEFRLTDENTLIAAMTEVVRLQFSKSVESSLDATLRGLPNAMDPANIAVGEAWQSLSRIVFQFVPIPDRLAFLSQAASEIPLAGLVELQMRELSS